MTDAKLLIRSAEQAEAAGAVHEERGRGQMAAIQRERAADLRARAVELDPSLAAASSAAAPPAADGMANEPAAPPSVDGTAAKIAAFVPPARMDLTALRALQSEQQRRLDPRGEEDRLVAEMAAIYDANRKG